ncbi:hypothetical protein NDU88_005094 [Pleurodeles waltl]|uniref:Uncharacterized protein n=1 Tax=Pleurodeles waltl TaxID=8319 RepID=A0AAV7MA81_PLEWA|nr:hypothetical protein NDU88_005094 [Pleurodeles waltl]
MLYIIRSLVFTEIKKLGLCQGEAGLSKVALCRADHQRYSQQFPGGIIGAGTGDPDLDTLTTNEDANPAEGGVFKPTTTSSRECTDSSGIDGINVQNQQWSRAEETTPGPGRQRRQQPDNLFYALWDEQEAARRTDPLRSGMSVA